MDKKKGDVVAVATEAIAEHGARAAAVWDARAEGHRRKQDVAAGSYCQQVADAIRRIQAREQAEEPAKPIIRPLDRSA